MAKNAKKEDIFGQESFKIFPRKPPCLMHRYIYDQTYGFNVGDKEIFFCKM